MKKRFLRGKASFMSLILVSALFSIYLMNPVSAADKRCCEKTNTGQYCVFTDAASCDLSVRSDNSAASCEQTSYCSMGCCQEPVMGSCYKSTSLAMCNALGGSFSSDPSCDNSECREGCCVIAGQCSFVNSKSCESLLQNFPGIQKDFRDVYSELECTNTCRSDDNGCCVNPDSCAYTSRGACSDGRFSNVFCSELDICGCIKHQVKGCFDDDVYWFDSCGNREEKVQNCDYASGTKCGKSSSGEFVCSSVDCAATYSDGKNVHDPAVGGLRRNGESWCVYESGTGDYRDAVGSRHFRHLCVNGEEFVEPCRDFREEVCVQASVSGYTEAQCIRNEIYDSEVKSNISTVPLGFRFWEDKGDCGDASQVCKVIYVKKNRFSSWDCVQNCECETQDYVDKMNRWCKSKGDCGANINVLGVKSESGFVVSGNGAAPRKISGSAWADYARPGVFGGMLILSEQFGHLAEAFAEDPQGLFGIGQGFGEALTVGAIAYAAMGIYGVKFYSFSILLAQGWAAPMLLTPYGWVVLVGVGLISFLIFSGGKTETKYVVTDCGAWQSPNTNDCDKCRSEEKFKKLGFDDCTEYKCMSLGSLCKFIPENEGSPRGSCFRSSVNDVNSPVITPWPDALTPGYRISSLDYGFAITPEFAPFTMVSFGIKTDEFSQCKISQEHSQNFDSMVNYFGDSSFDKQHNISLNLPNGREFTYYVRCRDVSGNSNSREYSVRLSTQSGPDLTPPVIEGTNMGDGSFVANSISSLTLNLFLNEPSDCKYSSSDLDYDAMEESASCETDVKDSYSYVTYDCYAVLNVSRGENSYYFRCKDLAGNKNAESYSFHLFGTEPLFITSINPSGPLYDTNSPTLEVTTASGAEDGKARCSFSTSELPFDSMVVFYETNSNLHRQPLANLPMSSYAYFVKCRDVANNEVAGSASFSVTVDSKAPEIRFLYSDGSVLHLTLSEPSNCEFSASSFSFGSGVVMDGSGTSELSLPADSPYYFINCVDIYNNAMHEIIVYP